MAEAFRDLAFRLDEALRHLPYALRGTEHGAADRWPVSADHPGGGRIIISGEPLPPRRLSSLIELPRCRISFVFEGVSENQQSAFLANFDRAFQRGGG